MKLVKSDRGWMSGIAGDDVATIGDSRLKAETALLMTSTMLRISWHGRWIGYAS